jgi:hypothetical protein
MKAVLLAFFKKTKKHAAVPAQVVFHSCSITASPGHHFSSVVGRRASATRHPFAGIKALCLSPMIELRSTR